ncbi:MAG: patatin family protein [Erysipelotrichaceae bacterium]|nr:patatin family protein [Erysipelotrichaceae bacterium]
MDYKTSLVLEGGGLRGAYTAGCLSWLLDNGLEFDNAYGISTGAIHLCSYLLKSKNYLRIISTQYINDKSSIGAKSFLRCGRIVDYDYMFNTLFMETVQFPFSRLKDIKSSAYIGLYELEKGGTEYHRIQDICLKELQASTTLPLIGQVMEIDENRHILDGGITEMIPIKQAIKDGCKKHLIIATKPIDYVRKPSKKFIVDLMKLVYPKWPSVADDYKVRDKNYVDQISRIKKVIDEGDGLYMCPSRKTNVTRLGGSKEELEDLYELGYQDMEAQKEKIFALFK